MKQAKIITIKLRRVAPLAAFFAVALLVTFFFARRHHQESARTPSPEVKPAIQAAPVLPITRNETESKVSHPVARPPQRGVPTLALAGFGEWVDKFTHASEEARPALVAEGEAIAKTR